ncbi:MAG: fimbrial protein [Luteibacter sp.]
MTHRKLRRAACALPLFALALPAAAAENGCYWSADGNYQLGQTAQIPVTNDLAPGDVVRDEKAAGDGNVLATCMEGEATFRGDYTVPLEGSLVPLTVGSEPSGFGIEVFINELKEAREYAFPHSYTRRFSKGDPVRSSEAEIRYRVRRMTGPVKFGAVDMRTIAEQWTYEPGGKKTDSFRHLKVYELVFIRPACSISADTLTQVVDMGAYNASAFGNPDRATRWVPFHLTVEECAEPVGLVANITFGTTADADPYMPEIFSLPGSRAPENVGLEIADGDKKTIKPGVLAQFNALGTGKSYPFNVRFRETKMTAGGGVVNRPITVMVDFR